MSPVAPDRTLVLAVGLERYDYGEGMDLPGAADGAVRFAQWALKCGVPAERVHLACSWLAEPPPSPPPDVRLVQTTRDMLDAALQSAVAVGGDLLLLYWCGHGLINEARERVLFTSNATAGNKLNIPVDEILKLLSSTQGIGFDRQILIVDACANFVEDMRFDAALPRSSLAKGAPREVPQFVLYAAEQGQIADYNRVERRAAFSTAVLAWLESEAGNTLPPDMSALRRHIGEDFLRRNGSGEHRQTPVSLVVQPDAGSEEWIKYGGLPVTGRLQAKAADSGLTVSQVHRLAETVLACSMLESDAVRDQFASAITGEAPVAPVDPPQLLALVSEAFAADGAEALLRDLWHLATNETQRLDVRKVEQCWIRQRRIANAMRHFERVSAREVRTAYYRAVPKDDRHVVRDLDDAMEWAACYGADSDGVVPLTKLVLMLECLTNVQVPDQWFAELGPGRLRGLRALAPKWLKVSDGRLVVDLHVSGPPSSRLRWPTTVAGYLYQGATGWSRLEPPVTCSPTERGVQDAVHELIERVDQMEIAEFTVGFILDRAAFETAPESWMQAQDLADPIPLGKLHPTVLHSGERLGAVRPRTLCRDRARAIRERLDHEPAGVCWIERDGGTDTRTIHRTVENSVAACIGFAFAPGKAGELNTDPIVAAVAKGAPFVLWVDQEPQDWAATRRTVADLVMPEPFDQLAERIRGRRAEGAGVPRLLWDDPAALPPREMLQGVLVERRDG